MNYAGAAFPKQVRIRDRKLLAAIRRQPCVVCSRRPAEASHIKSVGAGGGDTEDNVIPLCRKHHVEWHGAGRETMPKRYPRLAERLEGMIK